MAIDNYTIFIDPGSNIPYASFYIKGLYEVFGKVNVSFSTFYFTDLQKRNDNYSYDAYMAFVIINKSEISKVIIDFGDDYPIRENAHNWCDLYAKINFDPLRTPLHFTTKIQSIPPSFGIRIWSNFEIVSHAFSNLFKLKFSPQTSIMNYFRSYFSQMKQFPLETFSAHDIPDDPKNNEVFFIASLWPHPNCLTGTNVYRKMFIDTCLKTGVNFNGGFWVTDTEHPQFQEFKQLTFTKRYALKEYIEKTKKSMFVFNTPAVHNCHGWKLGQFLAMGKAIISTSFQNALPEDLVHGENIHFVNDASELEAAISELTHNQEYRRKLQMGAKRYYEKHGEPAAVIKKIFKRLNLNLN